MVSIAKIRAVCFDFQTAFVFLLYSIYFEYDDSDMKSRLQFSLCVFAMCIGASIACFGEESHVCYVVNEGCYIPVFETNESKFSYEVGEHGMNCYQLDTVLLPDTCLHLSQEGTNDIIKVSYYCAGDSSEHSGFIHSKLLSSCCKECEECDHVECCKYSDVQPMALSDIRALFDSCINENIPYCWGANNINAIDLNDMYEFTADNKDVPAFELRGFDCSGILHYISNGILPHCTRGLHVAGNELFKFEHGQSYTGEEKMAVINGLRDTDYIVCVRKGGGHVILSYKGGFLEFRDKDSGCVFTPKEDTLSRLDKIIDWGNDGESDVFVIRWHPEVM